jgi:nucleoside-triphosphatase
MPHERPRVLLLTGHPGVGKTTVIRRLAETLAGRRLGGFYTEEIRAHGERRGFRLVGFGSAVGAAVPAAINRGGACPGMIKAGDRRSPQPVGAAVPAAICSRSPANDRGGDRRSHIVDAIGKMECLSGRFIGAVRRLLDSGRPVVATVVRRGNGFIGEVKCRADATLWTVTRENRDRLPGEALAWLETVERRER